MAFLAPQEEEDKDKQPGAEDGQPAGGATAGQIVGGNTAPIGGGSSAPAAATGAPKGTSSGSYTNLKAYTNANQGNDSAMGAQVGGMVKKAENTANTAATGYQDNATAAITAGTLTDKDNLTGAVQTLGETGTGAIDQTQFNNLYNGGYSGPKTTDEGELGGARESAVTSSKKVQSYGTAAGGGMPERAGLLTDTYGTEGRQYSKGENMLDGFVLGSGEGGAKALTDINTNYSDFGKNFQGIETLLNSGIDQAILDSDTTRGNFQTTVGTARTGLEKRLDDAGTAAELANTEAGNQYKSVVAGEDAALTKLGYTPEAIAWMRAQPGGIDYSKLVSGPQKYGMSDFAKAEDVGGYRGLLSLLSGAGTTDATSKYADADLDLKGGAAHTTDSGILSGLNTASANEKLLQAELATKNGAREMEWRALSGYQGGLEKTAQQLGISPEDLRFYMENSPSGNYTQFLTKNRALNIGDVYGDDHRNQYSETLKMLGLFDDSAKYADAGDEGAAYSVNTAGLQAAIQALKDGMYETMADGTKVKKSTQVASSDTSGTGGIQGFNPYNGMDGPTTVAEDDPLILQGYHQ